MRFLSIRPLPAEKRASIARHRHQKKIRRNQLKASKAFGLVPEKTGSFWNVDEIEFSRAFALYRADMELLSPEEQSRFIDALMAYLSGALDPEAWRCVVSSLGALRKSQVQAEPAGYWRRAVEPHEDPWIV